MQKSYALSLPSLAIFVQATACSKVSSCSRSISWSSPWIDRVWSRKYSHRKCPSWRNKEQRKKSHCLFPRKILFYMISFSLSSYVAWPKRLNYTRGSRQLSKVKFRRRKYPSSWDQRSQFRARIGTDALILSPCYRKNAAPKLGPRNLPIVVLRQHVACSYSKTVRYFLVATLLLRRKRVLALNHTI